MVNGMVIRDSPMFVLLDGGNAHPERRGPLNPFDRHIVLLPAAPRGGRDPVAIALIDPCDLSGAIIPRSTTLPVLPSEIAVTIIDA